MRLPLIMGIVNATPDSFYDGGAYDPLIHFAQQLAAGADIIDVGGYSTRPGHAPVAPQEELARLLPLLKPGISIDSFTPVVIEAALKRGAAIVNDVSGLADIQIARLAAKHKAKLVIMHPDNFDALAEVQNFFTVKIEEAAAAGFPRENIILDIGLGFNKDKEKNWLLLENLDKFHQFNLPLLVGASRKRMTDKTLEGSLKAALLAAQKGAAILRVHDVAETIKYLKENL